MALIQTITDQEYVDLVKLWKSNDPVDSNEMVDMIEYCINKYPIPEESHEDTKGESK